MNNNVQPDNLTADYECSVYAAESDIMAMKTFLISKPIISLKWGTCIDKEKSLRDNWFKGKK